MVDPCRCAGHSQCSPLSQVNRGLVKLICALKVAKPSGICMRLVATDILHHCYIPVNTFTIVRQFPATLHHDYYCIMIA